MSLQLNSGQVSASTSTPTSTPTHLQSAPDLVAELDPAPDASAPFAGIGRVPALDHEPSQVAVKESLIIDAGGTEAEEVLARLWSDRREELELDVAQARMESDRHPGARAATALHSCVPEMG